MSRIHEIYYRKKNFNVPQLTLFFSFKSTEYFNFFSTRTPISNVMFLIEQGSSIALNVTIMSLKFDCRNEIKEKEPIEC